MKMGPRHAVLIEIIAEYSGRRGYTFMHLKTLAKIINVSEPSYTRNDSEDGGEVDLQIRNPGIR